MLVHHRVFVNGKDDIPSYMKWNIKIYKNHVPISTNQPDYSPIHVPSMSHPCPIPPFSQPKNPSAKVLPPVHISAMSSGTPSRSGRSGLGGQPGAELVIFDQGEVAEMELEPSKNPAKCGLFMGELGKKWQKLGFLTPRKWLNLLVSEGSTNLRDMCQQGNLTKNRFFVIEGTL